MRFDVQFKEMGGALPVKFAGNNDHFAIEFGKIQVVPVYPDADVYTGSYDVTPEVFAQKLNTKNKLMANDLSIRAIPYYEVSNVSGGCTVYIGTEV